MKEQLSEEADAAVPHDQRLALLAALPAFAPLPPAVLDDLAACLREERYPAGAAVVTEGDTGDRLFAIVEGRAEVTVAGERGATPLAALGPGELFGEVALLTPARTRQATVTALTPLRLLSLDRDEFDRLRARFPTLEAALAAGAEARLIAGFLKRASPFAGAPPERLAALAGRLARLDVPAGAAIVRQGDPGDCCYLLRRGAAEVLAVEDREHERRIATLSEGALLGEAALLTDAPRNATVRALEPCVLLVLRRDDLLAALGEDRETAARLRELVRLRDRPRQAPGILAHPRVAEDGEPIVTLKDPGRGRYYRLSAHGWFLWQRLDGRHTLRDLTLDYLREFGAFAPDLVAEVVGGLVRAGFATVPALRADVAGLLERTAAPPVWQRLLRRARRALEWYVPLRGVDPALTRLYRRAGWLLFTRPALALLALVAVAGLAAFFLGAERVQVALAAARGRHWLPLVLIPAGLVALLLHEAGHALATKAFGREVHSVGVGWYWFGPVAFVDTSDMWLAGRGPRLAVNVAGVCANLVVAGAAALASRAAPDPTVAAVLWQFALAQYLTVLINLNPLLELDGYFVLIDLLDRPNLRPRALAWLGRELLPALRRAGWRGLRGHGLALGYGLAAVVYIGVQGALVVILYRLLAQDWFATLLPDAVAAGLTWVLAAAVVGLALAGIVADLRGQRATGA